MTEKEGTGKLEMPTIDSVPTSGNLPYFYGVLTYIGYS